MLESPRQPQPAQVFVDIAPTVNALHSLTSVSDALESPGIGAWAVETRQALSDETWGNHRIVAKWIGPEPLINAIPSEAARASFPAFLDSLKSAPPELLRDDIFKWMTARPGMRLDYKPYPKTDNPLSLLASQEAFLSFYMRPEKSDADVQTTHRVYDLFTDPPALKAFLCDYLSLFWETYLKDEWARSLPEFKSAVKGFEQIDITGLSHFEVIETITRRNFRGAFRPDVLQEIPILRFIPSLHNGPYILKTMDGEELNISFGAYHLTERIGGEPVVDGTQVVERLKALGDENRLEIIQLLKIERELGTQEIIDHFGLSKSAASRHIRQLVANGIVDVRVDEDGLSKFYRLNPSFMNQMQEMLGKLLG